MPTQNLRTATPARRRLRAGLVALALPVALAAGASGASAAVSGNVFQDFDSDGVRDAGGLNAAADAPVAGITVRGFNAKGKRFGPVTTDAEGNYSLPAPSGKVVRVEFSGLPKGWGSSFAGADSGTSVQFVKAPAKAVDFAVTLPADYCQNNPTLATNCYVFGKQFDDGVFAENEALVSFPYAAEGDVELAKLAKAKDIGTTWGLAWDRSRSRIYSAAYAKRHAGFGPNGPGAIYSTDPDSGTTSLLFDVNTIGENYSGVDPHPTGPSLAAGTGENTWHHDANVVGSIGKIAFGDIDVADDGSTLFAMNLATRELMEIPLGGTIEPGSVRRTAVPTPAGANSDDVRPFAVTYHRGTVYVGVVNSAESTGNRADLHAYVYAFTPGGDFSGPVLDFPLDYQRACAVTYNCDGGATASWNPWTSTFDPGEPASNLGFNPRWNPQPILSDIEIAPDGGMVLGLRDRYGDVLGNFAGPVDLNDSTTLYEASADGDVLRAAPLSAGGWGLENNGASPEGASALFGPNDGAGNGHGPGGGEFYYQESLAGSFDETSLGGLAQVPGFGSIAQTQRDPVGIRQSGVTTLSHSDGSTATRFVVDQGSLDTPPTRNGSFSKANGLGDIEALCQAAPIQIGNRIWVDKDRDGVQDAGESGINGVMVRLYDGQGKLIATTKTRSGGQYYFDASNVPGGIAPATKYSVRVPLAQKKLKNFALTRANATKVDTRDSDATKSGPFGRIIIKTSSTRTSDHTYDIGFVVDRTRVAITKTAPSTVRSGETIDYRIRVKNVGGRTAREVTVTDVLPEGLALIRRTSAHRSVRVATARYKRALKVSRRSLKSTGAKRVAMRRVAKARAQMLRLKTGSPRRYANARGTLRFALGSIAKGKSKTITLRVRVLSTTRGNRTNKAIARAVNAPQVSDNARTRIQGIDFQTLPAVTG